jgi:hypothetical protein
MFTRSHRARLFITAISATWTTAVLAPCSWSGESAVAQAQAPALPKAPDRLVPDFPSDPVFDEKGTVEHDRPFFNHFAWQVFVSLNWPAEPTKRGVANAAQAFGEKSAPVVWGTWKSIDQLFLGAPAQQQPSPWEDFDDAFLVTWDQTPILSGPRRPGASSQGNEGALGIASPYRLALVDQAGLIDDDPTDILVAQNGTLVRYDVRVNKIEYDLLLKNKYYIYEKLPEGSKRFEFCEGSVHVKAAWMDLSGVGEDQRKRFYVQNADLLDFDSNGKPIWVPRPMGLVGLHIVVKTRTRKDFIWCTFEHVDNLAPTCSGAPASFSRHVPPLPFGSPGTNAKPGLRLPFGKPLPESKSTTSVEVVREYAIDQSIETVNCMYRNHPQIKHTVWSNYKLVGTQWPKLGKRTISDPASRLPATLANVAIETYSQGSCMGCHAGASKSEFVFYPVIRAYIPPERKAARK